MGAGSSSCLIKNRLGRGKDIRVVCWCAPKERLGSAVACPDAEAICFEGTIKHGAEQQVEDARQASPNLLVAARLGADGGEAGEALLITVPNGATLSLKDYGGSGVARICRPDSQVWEIPHVADATALFRALAASRSPTPTAAASAAPAAKAPAAKVAAVPRQVQRPANSDSLSSTSAAGAGSGGSSGSSSSSKAPPPSGQPVSAGRPHAGGNSGGGLGRSSGGGGSGGGGGGGEGLRAPSSTTVAPAECVCPISHEVFADPVLAADGFTYERDCIEEWWRRKGPKSPMTGRDVPSTALVPNLAIRALCAEIACAGQGRREALQQTRREAAGTAFYDAHMPALTEMFSHLEPDAVRGVCAGLAEQGVFDIDACVRCLLERTGSGGQAASAVSLAPVCCAADAAQADAAVALLDPLSSIPEQWSAEREELYMELLKHQFPPVRSRKALDFGAAESFEEAVEWLERHQDDEDIDVPVEILQQRDAHRLALDVMRVATVPTLHRLECFQALHKILGRILADPESQRLRQIRIHNEKFRQQLGRFRPAVALLRSIGFKQGDFWVSATQREPCLEFRLPVDSDNPTSQRFVRAYSLLDEVLRAPDDWLATIPEAQPEVTSTWALEEEAGGGEPLADADGQQSSVPGGGSGAHVGAAPAAGDSRSRAFLAELHERRARDPRGFQEAMRAAGRQPNKVVVDLRIPPPSSEEESAARRLDGAAGSSQPGGSPRRRYRRLSERFGGRREFNLQDLEDMRVEDAIEGRTFYAREYDAQRGTSSSYADLVTRSYDPQYLGRKAVDDTNTFRAQQRMPPLRWSQAVADIAAEHARQMARGEMPFSHQGFDERVRQYPFAYFSAAENLAYNSGVADAAGQAVQGWIKSPGHRKNLLGAFDLCGIGVAQSAAGHFFFTQLFARTAGGALC